jgi:hypothetical protein
MRNSMSLKGLAITLVAALAPAAAQPPLPGLRVEPISGGTVFYVKNTASQPLAAFILELDGYPGSGYVLVQDESSSEPIPPGGEKRIESTNMTPGAVPDYMKLQAAIYADGTSAGKPEKVAQLGEHRRAMLETARGLIGRLDKAKSAGTEKAALIADLRQWAGSIPEPSRRDRFRAVGVNQSDSRNLMERTATQLEARSLDDVLAGLRATERALAASRAAP